MTDRRALEIMKVELECVEKADYCNRECRRCELVQDSTELKEAYRHVMKLLEEREEHKMA